MQKSQCSFYNLEFRLSHGSFTVENSTKLELFAVFLCEYYEKMKKIVIFRLILHLFWNTIDKLIIFCR